MCPGGITSGNTLMCSVPDQVVLGSVPPTIETLQADSRAVLCCPEDGRLTFEGWWLSLRVHLCSGVIQLVVETSAREPLISTRPLAVAKCWAWLVSKEFNVCQAPSLVILKFATVSHPTLLSSPDNPAHTKKNSGYKKTLIPIIWEV